MHVWEIICDHKYNWGLIAADRSPWGSNGVLGDVSALPGRAGLHFSGPQSHVAVPRRASDPWGTLVGIIIEITARVDQAGGTLVHGHQSFRIWSGNQNIIYAETPSGVASSNSIPLGEWFRVRFSHNGFNAYGLGYDYPGGSGGGSTRATSIVPGLGPLGILIGNRIGNSAEHLTGDIAGIRIWRHDPHAPARQFSSRPFDPEAAACWAAFFKAVREALEANPECREWLTSAIESIRKQVFDGLATIDRADLDAFRGICAEYRRLWTAGRVDSVEMLTLMKRLRDWLKDKGLLNGEDPALLNRLDSPCVDILRKSLPSLDCDPAAQALLAVLIARDQT
jgi:hypothetical protein